MKYLLILLAFFSTPAFAEVLTAEKVQKEIDIHSPRSALKMYFGCDDTTAYDHVAQGTKQWLNIAIQMLPYLDACYGESMRDAFGRAMLAAPVNVLPYVNSQPHLAASDICLPLMIEWPDSKVRDHLDRLDTALKSIPDERLKDKAAACLQQSGALRAKLKK